MRYITLCFLVLIVFTSCSDNVGIDNSLKKYFDENKVDGCFALMDNRGQFTIYNLSRYRDSSYLPAATFDIVNYMIGMQTGKISTDSTGFKLGSTEIPVADWSKEVAINKAFRASATKPFQEVARRVGKTDMQYWLDSLHYGTTKIKTTVDSFWLDNSLKIKPDEQLGLVKQMYFNQLPFFPVYQETVQRAMLLEAEANYRLGYKTGSGFTERGYTLGWIVGWIEENNHPYFFVLNIESPEHDYDMSKTLIKILKDILKEKGFFQGKM
jgi:beta-lactamase class D